MGTICKRNLWQPCCDFFNHQVLYLYGKNKLVQATGTDHCNLSLLLLVSLWLIKLPWQNTWYGRMLAKAIRKWNYSRFIRSNKISMEFVQKAPISPKQEWWNKKQVDGALKNKYIVKRIMEQKIFRSEFLVKDLVRNINSRLSQGPSLDS